MRRHHNPRRAKALRTYDVAEAAELYGCHRNTVRNWLQKGLVPIDNRRPILLLGGALNSFHAARRTNAKRPCGPGEIYCVACRKPQIPDGGFAEYVARTPTLGTLTAICPDCSRLISQRIGAARLATFRALVEVSERNP